MTEDKEIEKSPKIKGNKKTKSSNINVRVYEDVKEKAENILNELGISHTTAIEMYYRQIIQHKGLPFEVTLKGKTDKIKKRFTLKRHGKQVQKYIVKKDSDTRDI